MTHFAVIGEWSIRAASPIVFLKFGSSIRYPSLSPSIGPLLSKKISPLSNPLRGPPISPQITRRSVHLAVRKLER